MFSFFRLSPRRPAEPPAGRPAQQVPVASAGEPARRPAVFEVLGLSMVYQTPAGPVEALAGSTALSAPGWSGREEPLRASGTSRPLHAGADAGRWLTRRWSW